MKAASGWREREFLVCACNEIKDQARREKEEKEMDGCSNQRQSLLYQIQLSLHSLN